MKRLPHIPTTPNDLDHVPAGMIRADDARALLELLSADARQSIERLIASADVSPEYRDGLESALDRADAKAAAFIDGATKPKANA